MIPHVKAKVVFIEKKRIEKPNKQKIKQNVIFQLSQFSIICAKISGISRVG